MVQLFSIILFLFYFYKDQRSMYNLRVYISLLDNIHQLKGLAVTKEESRVVFIYINKIKRGERKIIWKHHTSTEYGSQSVNNLSDLFSNSIPVKTKQTMSTWQHHTPYSHPAIIIILQVWKCPGEHNTTDKIRNTELQYKVPKLYTLNMNRTVCN